MDTSETYIKMCNCPEIQEKWDVNTGDYYWTGKSIEITEWLLSHIYHFAQKHMITDTYVEEQLKDCIWLPRQDQAQKMIGDMGRCYEAFYEMILFDQRNLGQEAKTMEQMWLIVYMHEEHGKAWSGTKWKKK